MSDGAKTTEIAEGKTQLLLVEGTHEKRLVTRLAADRSILAPMLQVLPIAGKTNLQQSLRALKNDRRFPDIRAMGIVRDADCLPPAADSADVGRSAAQLAFAAVCGCLRNVGLSVPAEHAAFAGETPTTGVFILPDGHADGMLETLCWSSVAAHPASACVTAYFECLRQQGLIDSPSPKAWTHAYIAAQKEPDVHIGIAAQNGYWDLTHAAFDPLCTFLQALAAIA